MKYIDADRLREELQKPKNELKVGNYYLDNSEQAVGYENALIDFELIIDSLQQDFPTTDEQMKGLDVTDFCQPIHPDIAKVLPDVINELTWGEQEPEGDLGADIEMEWDSFNKHLVEYDEGPEEVVWLNWISFNDVACYFYELGLKAKKEEEK